MELVTVETRYGAVAGAREDDLVVFKGIPYAAPPVGARRFAAPEPPEPWLGTREALEFAPLSIQPPPDPTSAIPGDPAEQSEDCLYLNVYTPACDGGARPVMVWIHGGGFVSGGASSALYRGDRLAAEDVVVVTIGYRLGVLGWLGDEALAAPADPAGGFGNWGLRDQLFALEWVRDHARLFGGDPESVTVFGESAGGMSVAALLATDAPGRLFKRAIIESGAALAIGADPAARIARAVAGELGLDRPTRRELLEMPAAELLKAQTAVNARFEVVGLPFQPVIDGTVLSDHPATRIAAGSAAGVDVLIGTNRDEWRFWTLSNPAFREMDDDKLAGIVAHQIERLGLDGELDPVATVDTYRSARNERGDATEPADLHCAISSDWVFRVPSTRLVAGHAGRLGRTYSYLFDWESPLGGGLLGSCHALEIPFVFGSCDHPFVAYFSGGGEEAERLSATMRRAWAAFAHSGDPSTPTDGKWPSYEEERRATKRLGPVVEVIEAPMETERAWLDKAFGPYGELEHESSARFPLPDEQD